MMRITTWFAVALSVVVPTLGVAQSTGPERVPIPDPRIPPSVGPTQPIPRFNTRKPGAPIRPPSIGLFTLDSAVVEDDNVMLLLAPLPKRYRYELAGKRGYFSWRIDALSGAGLSVVLAADSMMRTTDVKSIVKGSTLRRCLDPTEPTVRKCAQPMPTDSAHERLDYVQITLRDTAIVNYFRNARPSQVTATFHEPEGRFRVDVIPIAYYDTKRNLK